RSECMRPPTRVDDSYTIESMPASRSCRAVTRPAIPAPTITTRSRPRACDDPHAANSGTSAAAATTPAVWRRKVARELPSRAATDWSARIKELRATLWFHSDLYVEVDEHIK